MAHDDDTKKLQDLFEKQRFVMLTTSEGSGRLVSRPMTVQERDGWTVRFITQAGNDAATQSDGQQVNLAVADGGTYLSLSGTGRVENDLAKKQELWNRLNEAYAGDAEDPENVILEVTVDSGEYWDAGNPIVRVAGLAAAVIGKRPAGDHGEADVS